jgi:hypothetical protein
MRSILHRVPGIAHKFLDRVACRFRSCGPLFPLKQGVDGTVELALGLAEHPLGPAR